MKLSQRIFSRLPLEVVIKERQQWSLRICGRPSGERQGQRLGALAGLKFWHGEKGSTTMASVVAVEVSGRLKDE